MLSLPTHTKIWQQVRLLFTLPWRILASYFLFKIMEELFDVKNFTGIKYSEGWQWFQPVRHEKEKMWFFLFNKAWYSWSFSWYLKPDCKQVLEKNIAVFTQDFSSWFQVRRDLDRHLNNSRHFKADLALILLSRFSTSSIVLSGV